MINPENYGAVFNQYYDIFTDILINDGIRRFDTEIWALNNIDTTDSIYFLNHMAQKGLQPTTSIKRPYSDSDLYLNDIKRGKFTSPQPIDSCTNIKNFIKLCTENSDKAQHKHVKLTQDVMQMFEKFKQFDQTTRFKSNIKDAIESHLRYHFKEASLFVIGSSNSGFGIEESDLDMCLHLPHIFDCDNRRVCSVLFHIRKLFNRSSTIKSTLVIPARVPILKLVDVKSDIEIDMNINNIVGIYNTYLLRAYSYADERVAPFMILIKTWAKYHDINDASRQSLSSYSIALMVINFFQVKCDPPVLPSLQMRHKDMFDTDQHPLDYFNDFDYLRSKLDWKSENHLNIGQLLPQFFQYYAQEFDYDRYALSVRQGTIISRNQVIGNIPNIKYRNNQSWKYVCVEEPFDRTNTAYSTYNFNTFKRIIHTFKCTAENIQASADIASLFHRLPFDIT